MTSPAAAFWSKDDHDFRFNDADLAGRRLPTAVTGIEVFREQLPVVPAGDRDSPTYRTHRVHRHLQLWFTEGRDYRSPNAAPDDGFRYDDPYNYDCAAADLPGRRMPSQQQRRLLQRHPGLAIPRFGACHAAPC